MKKKWTKYYLFLGTVVMLVLSALCSYTFVRGNIVQLQDKKTFESIYEETSIDFIVPSPAYTQIGEIEQDGNNGIERITPFFETKTPVTFGSNSSKGTTIIIPDAEKVEYTPYSASRIISGSKTTGEGNAIMDKMFSTKNSCKVGETISLTIGGKSYEFVISGVAETNTYYKDGTIAVILSEDEAREFENAGLKYSAAYISANDYEKCKGYLYSEYKPLGRLKDKDEFDSEDAYKQHVKNFDDADWTKEITNCKDNYNKLSVKYENVNAGVFKNMIIAMIIVFFVVIVLNTFLIRSETLKQFFQTFLIKKSGTKTEVKSFYKNGITFNTVVFIITTICLYCLISVNLGSSIFGIRASTSMAIIIAQIVSSLIMIGISGGYVERKYSIKNKQTESETVEQNNESIDTQ